MDNTSFNIDTALAIASESSVIVKYIKVIIWSMVPIAESRVAIPYGILPVAQGGLGLPLFSVAVVSVVANIVVTIPIIYLLDPISNFLRRYKIFDKFFVWLFARSEKRGRIVDRLKVLGLIIFIGIPLPITGAWTGCVAAHIFGLSKTETLIGVCLGVTMMVAIITAGSYGVLQIFW